MVVEDHEEDDEACAEDGGFDGGATGVIGESRADFVHLFEFEFDFERVIEDVGELEGFALGELAGDDGMATWDGFIDAGSGVELAIEYDGEAADFGGIVV